MAANGKQVGGYKAAAMAQGLPPVANGNPNQANQGMPSIAFRAEPVQDATNMLSILDAMKLAQEQEYRRVQEEQTNLASLIATMEAKFPGKKLILVDKDADLVPRHQQLPPAPAAPVVQKEENVREDKRWTPDSNYADVEFVTKGKFVPFICNRAGCSNRGKLFWGNIQHHFKKDCAGCNRVLVPIKPENQVGYILYGCPDEECAYCWVFHPTQEGDTSRMKLSDAPAQDCPICGTPDVAPCRVGNDRLLAAWLVKGALNEWYALTGFENHSPSAADAAAPAHKTKVHVVKKEEDGEEECTKLK